MIDCYCAHCMRSDNIDGHGDVYIADIGDTCVSIDPVGSQGLLRSKGPTVGCSNLSAVRC